MASLFCSTLRMSMSAPKGQRWAEEQIWKSWVMGLDWDYSKASGLFFTHAENIAYDDVRQPDFIGSVVALLSRSSLLTRL